MREISRREARPIGDEDARIVQRAIINHQLAQDSEMRDARDADASPVRPHILPSQVSGAPVGAGQYLDQQNLELTSTRQGIVIPL